MDAIVAHRLARTGHAGQRNRFGEPIAGHVERVAYAVPVEARPLAYLHDLLERTDTTVMDLRAGGMTDTDYAALQLLTHRANETYETYVRRIARARGSAGRLARIVKLADLDDHLRHSRIPPQAPNYAWARRQIAIAQKRERQSAADMRTPVKVVASRASKRERQLADDS